MSGHSKSPAPPGTPAGCEVLGTRGAARPHESLWEAALRWGLRQDLCSLRGSGKGLDGALGWEVRQQSGPHLWELRLGTMNKTRPCSYDLVHVHPAGCVILQNCAVTAPWWYPARGRLSPFGPAWTACSAHPAPGLSEVTDGDCVISAGSAHSTLAVWQSTGGDHLQSWVNGGITFPALAPWCLSVKVKAFFKLPTWF